MQIEARNGIGKQDNEGCGYAGYLCIFLVVQPCFSMSVSSLKQGKFLGHILTRSSSSSFSLSKKNIFAQRIRDHYATDNPRCTPEAAERLLHRFCCLVENSLAQATLITETAARGPSEPRALRTLQPCRPAVPIASRPRHRSAMPAGAT